MLRKPNLHYHGSITLDPDHCHEAGILPMEFVEIWTRTPAHAEVVRRLIRASAQAGPALSTENTRAVVELAQVRMVGRNLAQVLKAIHRGQAVRIEDTEPVWRGLHEVVAAINDELTEMTVAYGSKLRREAKLALPAEVSAEELT